MNAAVLYRLKAAGDWPGYRRKVDRLRIDAATMPWVSRMCGATKHWVAFWVSGGVRTLGIGLGPGHIAWMTGRRKAEWVLGGAPQELEIAIPQYRLVRAGGEKVHPLRTVAPGRADALHR